MDIAYSRTNHSFFGLKDMKYLYLIAAMTFINNTEILFDFELQSNLSDWTIVNDGVMGGVSESDFAINADGNSVFSGKVSLDYNGGFASVRYNPEEIDVEKYESIVIRCKGKPNRYQVRAKSSWRERHSYIQYIEITEDWQELEVSMSDMYPQFRGYELEMPNYPKEKLGEFAILIGNKRYEDFQIEIDWIKLK